ncbi:JmjC domain-containing protein [Streptomyces californicus]|uniref:JmjC domain-containing protein n=1 Tax=Streptomyces californicus TaxID=67351 RepID=UPI00296F927B|nr:cupin domain-containing protein [Streptomyces californicus]MDW4917712.1 cupin domain-containing protein [Streptomyces californicus]
MSQPLTEADFATVDVPAASQKGGAPSAPVKPDLASFPNDLVKELSPAWGKRRLHRAGIADASHLFTATDIDQLLASRTLRVANMWLVHHGKTIPPSQYIRVGDGEQPRSNGRSDVGRVMTLATEGSPDPQRVAQFIAAGATMTLNLADGFVPVLSDLCDEFEAQLKLKCALNVFVTPPSARGFNLHSDPHDVVVIQTHGTKQWEIHPTPWEKERDPDATVQQLTLHPGDLLYLPEGTPHMAMTEDGLSVHLTVQFNVPTYDLVAQRVLDEVLSALKPTEMWARPLDLPGQGTGDLADHVTRTRNQLVDALQQLNVPAATSSHLNSRSRTRRSKRTGCFLAIAEADSVTPDTLLQRAREAQVEQTDEKAHLYFGQRCLITPRTAFAFLDALTRAQEPFTAADLPADLDSASRLALCKRLVREGVLTASA